MAKILIAEDDESMRNFMLMALRRAGHEVEASENGLAALERLADDRSFELLLADIVMPGMDGIELAKKAAFVQPGLKVMFITGFAGVALNAQKEEEAQERHHPCPAQKVMSKPFHLKDLVDQVDRLLAA